MNLDAVGLVRLPDWADNLRQLMWRLRAARPSSRPSPRTWTRRVTAEKRRLLELGVPANELHMVCRILRASGVDAVRQFKAERQYVHYMARKQRGETRWELDAVPRRGPVREPGNTG